MITDYITEKSLIEFVKQRIDPNIICNKQIPDSGLKIRPDIRSEKHKIIIEYDGPLHYTKPSNIVSDMIRDKNLNKLGYNVIRFPYFVQLDELCINYFFNNYLIDRSGFNEYPHGFIDEKVIYPSEFCDLGVKRFKEFMNSIPFEIREQITKSLNDAAKDTEYPELFLPTYMLTEK